MCTSLLKENISQNQETRKGHSQDKLSTRRMIKRHYVSLHFLKNVTYSKLLYSSKQQNSWEIQLHWTKIFYKNLGLFFFPCYISLAIPILFTKQATKMKFLINAQPASPTAQIFLYNYISQIKCAVLSFNFYYSHDGEVLIIYSLSNYEI